MNALRFLPGTHYDVAAGLHCTPKQACGILYYYKSRGLARKTDRRVPNGTTRQGAKSSPLWERV